MQWNPQFIAKKIYCGQKLNDDGTYRGITSHKAQYISKVFLIDEERKKNVMGKKDAEQPVLQYSDQDFDDGEKLKKKFNMRQQLASECNFGLILNHDVTSMVIKPSCFYFVDYLDVFTFNTLDGQLKTYQISIGRKVRTINVESILYMFTDNDKKDMEVYRTKGSVEELDRQGCVKISKQLAKSGPR